MILTSRKKKKKGVAGPTGHVKLSRTQLRAPRRTVMPCCSNSILPSTANGPGSSPGSLKASSQLAFRVGCSGWDQNTVPSQARGHAVSQIQTARSSGPAERSHGLLLFIELSSSLSSLYPCSFKLRRTIKRSYYHPPVTAKGMEV